MVDTVDKATRSRTMAQVHSKDTKPEMLVRKALFARGMRYRLHDSKLPGKPDMVFPRYKAVICINGCFWHGHDCRRFRLPSSNVDYWQAKIDRNQARDQKNCAALEALGWRVLILWECSIPSKQSELASVITSTIAWLKAPIV